MERKDPEVVADVAAVAALLQIGAEIGADQRRGRGQGS